MGVSLYPLSAPYSHSKNEIFIFNGPDESGQCTLHDVTKLQHWHQKMFSSG
jgi:hypothetical protein